MKYSQRTLLVFIQLCLLVLPAVSEAANFKIVGLAQVTQEKAVEAAATSDGFLGYGGGLLAEFSKSAVGLEIGALYVQRQTGYTAEITKTTTWIQAPILARLHFLGFTLGAGGYVSYAIGDVKFGGSNSDYSSAQLKKLDYGALTALGYELGFGKTGLLVEARYAMGLANLSTAATTLKNTDIQFLAGLRF